MSPPGPPDFLAAPGPSAYRALFVGPSITLDSVFADDLCSLYRWRSLVVVAWRATPTTASLGPANRAVGTILRANPGAFQLCSLLGAGSALPDAETREALRAGIRKLGKLRAAVTVISGTGFRAAAMRAMMSGLSLVVRQTFPTGFVGNEADAAAFLVRYWPEVDAPAPGRGELARALADVAATPAARAAE